MGYHRGQGARRCAICWDWFAVQSLVKLGTRHYCERDAAYVRTRRRATLRRRARLGGPPDGGQGVAA